MISSNQNPKIKQIRALMGRPKERREAGAFVVEGVRLVEELVKSEWGLKFVLYDENLSDRGKAIVATLKIRGVEVEEVSSSVMQSVSETETPQGIFAVAEIYQPFEFAQGKLSIITRHLPFFLIPDQIRDPGNLGTLIRSAAAAGVDAILLPPETTDAFAPKVIRAGMGAHFRLPIHSLSWNEIEASVKGMQVFVADMDGDSCWESNLNQPLAMIVGSEADGASSDAFKLAHQKIRIPMNPNIESLNAGAAGSILMFEVARQRKLL